MSTDTVRVLLVDDHAVVRAGYKRYLELGPTLQVVGEADTGELAYGMIAHTPADVVMLDLSMPRKGGCESLTLIMSRYP